MCHKDIVIRTASGNDAKELLQIYTPYVENTAITFEYEVPDLEEFRSRIKNTLKKYPYLVAEKNGEILGYAYTGAFAGRAAYGWAAQAAIYLSEDRQKAGLGRLLYRALEDISKEQRILNMTACIAYPEIEDEHLTKNSMQFHEHLGYRPVGHFHKCGYKFGTWYDVIWMEKIIGGHPLDPSPVIWFSNLNASVVASLCLP